MKILYSYFVYFWLFIAAITKGYALRYTYGVALASVTISVISDFCTLSIPFILFHFIRVKSNNFIKSFGASFVLLYLGTYLFDTLLLLGLNARLDLRVISGNGLEWSVALAFLQEKYPALIAFCILFSIASFFKFSHIRSKVSFHRTCIPIIMILCGAAYSNMYSKYSFNPIYLVVSSFQEVQAPLINDYSQLQTAYKKVTSESLDLPLFNKNIILLVVESLSAVDSKRMGGMYDRMPELDELSKKGILFTNFYGNHFNSEGGFISMLCGLPPVTYPGFSALGYRDYPCFSKNLVKQFKNMGFVTEFLTTGPLAYAQKGSFMRNLGFDLVRGRDEVGEFKSAPRYSFASPADELLYAEAFKRIGEYGEKKQKFFLNLFTVSSHRPYQDPRGGEYSVDSVFSYVGLEINKFYTALENSGYLEDGILIVVGDHRRMDIIPDVESNVYGEKAKNWVWLALFGSDVLPGIRVENISQHNLLSRLLKVVNGGEIPSANSVSFTNPWEYNLESRSGIIDLTSKRAIDSKSIDLVNLRNASLYVRKRSIHPCERFERNIQDLDLMDGIHASAHLMQSLETISAEKVYQAEKVQYKSVSEAIAENASRLVPSTIHIQADLMFPSEINGFLNIVGNLPACILVDGKLQAVKEINSPLSALPSSIAILGGYMQHFDFLVEASPITDVAYLDLVLSNGIKSEIDSHYTYHKPLK